MARKSDLDFFPLYMTQGTPLWEAFVAVKVAEQRVKAAKEAYAALATPALAAKGVTAPPGTRIVYGFKSDHNAAYAFSKAGKEGISLT